jgi:hypothetical protein
VLKESESCAAIGGEDLISAIAWHKMIGVNYGAIQDAYQEKVLGVPSNLWDDRAGEAEDKFYKAYLDGDVEMLEIAFSPIDLQLYGDDWRPALIRAAYLGSAKAASALIGAGWYGGGFEWQYISRYIEKYPQDLAASSEQDAMLRLDGLIPDASGRNFKRDKAHTEDAEVSVRSYSEDLGWVRAVDWVMCRSGLWSDTSH